MFDFNKVRMDTLKLALDCGCNIALVDAVHWAKDVAELRGVAHRANGVGAQRVKEFIESALAGVES